MKSSIPCTPFATFPASKPDKRMIEIAQKIIDQQEGAFDPEDFKDRYEAALRELIRRKEKGENSSPRRSRKTPM